jgi:benzodiazapine receptor
MDHEIQPNQQSGSRWFAFLAILGNIIFSYASYMTPQGRPINKLDLEYYNLFTPAGYTFSIWAIIFLSFTVYAVVQFFPGQSHKWIYDNLSRPLIIANLLCMGWIMCAQNDLMASSMVIMGLLLVTSITMYGRVKRAMVNDDYSRWIQVPFSLLLSWVCVLMVSNVAMYLVGIGWYGNSMTESNWTMTMITFLFILSLLISFVFRDWIFPLVIGWGVSGISVANRYLHADLAYFSIFIACALVAWGLAMAIYRYGQYPKEYLRRKKMSHFKHFYN